MNPLLSSESSVKIPVVKRRLRRWCRIFFWVGLSIVGLLALWILANRFDTPPPENDITEADLLPAPISIDNGFYVLVNLFQERGENIFSAERLEQTKKAYSQETYSLMLAKPVSKPKFLSNYFEFCELDCDDLVYWAKPEESLGKKTIEFFQTTRRKIDQLKVKYHHVLERYEQMLRCETIADFSSSYPFSDYYSFRLLKSVSRLFLAHVFWKMESGEWQWGMEMLEKNVHFCRKLVPVARPFLHVLTGLTMFTDNIEYFLELASRRETPDWVLERLSQILEKVSLEDFDIRNCIKFGYILKKNYLINVILKEDLPILEKFCLLFLFHPNRTCRYLLDDTRMFMRLFGSSPAALATKSFVIPSYTDKPFWWLLNLYGKIEGMRLRDDGLHKFYQAFVRNFQASQFFKTIIRLQLRFSSDDPPQAVAAFLNRPDMRDPITDNPYVYDAQNKTLSMTYYNNPLTAEGRETRKDIRKDIQRAFGVSAATSGEAIGETGEKVVRRCLFRPRVTGRPGIR